MKLTYYDGFSFACAVKNGTFVVNPRSHDTSLLFSVFTTSDRDMSYNDNALTWPGEYEFGGAAVQLFELDAGNLGAKVVVENVRIVFLPQLQKQLSEPEMEILGNVDILIFEIQETTSGLKKMIEEIDAKVVLPVGGGREKFLMEMGAGASQAVSDFTCSAPSLPIDKTEFVKLEAQ